jgi:RNA-directed DNA polymerase
MERAWKRVRANKGSAGVDGRSVKETGVYLKTHWPRLKAQLLCGTYRPSPIRRVEIAKSEGGVRELGIPTVTDRLMKPSAIAGAATVDRSGLLGTQLRLSSWTACARCAALCPGACTGRIRVVVDIDLEKFFDRVNHDVLLDRLNRRIGDRAVLRLVRRYLEAGVMVHGVVQERYEGTPQGGPLSPLLANVLLDEVDRELERRGHRLRSAMPTTATCM